MIYVNHNLKALYFHIPKCGGTNIKKLLVEKYGFIFINQIKKRRDHFTEFCENDISLDLPNQSANSIRKKGVFRYFIDNNFTNDLLNMDDEKWKTYFKFTFIRDPYKKIISAFNFLKYTYNTVPLYCQDFCYKNFNSFFEFKTMINNFGYYHTFITQNDHLLDHKMKINVNYIGNIDNYDEEMSRIFEIIGIKGSEINNLDENNEKQIYNKNISYDQDKFYEFYDEKTFNLVNELFSIDFDLLNFKKQENFTSFVEYYSQNTKNETYESFNSPVLCSLCNKFNAYNKRALNVHCFYCK
jgi:hypothetical protein